jgi:hypothetical protein
MYHLITHHLFPRVEWGKLPMSFRKLRLYMDSVTALLAIAWSLVAITWSLWERVVLRRLT